MDFTKKFTDKFKKKPDNENDNDANPENTETLDASEVDDNDQINELLNKFKAENDELQKKYETALRMVAEKDNQLKNTIEMNKKDIQLAKDDYAKKFIGEIASEFDNFFRVLELINKELSQENSETMSGIAKKFMDAFSKVGVSFIQPEIGENFNSNMHNIITQVPNPEFKTGQIVHVISSCWKVGDKIVKFADVIVAS